MTQRFQFSLRALLVVMFGAACFFGGIRVERERRRRADALQEARLQEALGAGLMLNAVQVMNDPGPEENRDTIHGPGKARAEALETLGFGR
ncbi:MAG TPA: hypothetical protein VJ783_24180 [Pirellulales bacterium]|nr:hypothetical protein [Pirellulales bacterium]